MRVILTPDWRARRGEHEGPTKRATGLRNLFQTGTSLPAELLAPHGRPMAYAARARCVAPHTCRTGIERRRRAARKARSALNPSMQTTTWRPAKPPGPNSNNTARNEDPHAAGVVGSRSCRGQLAFSRAHRAWRRLNGALAASLFSFDRYLFVGAEALPRKARC